VYVLCRALGNGERNIATPRPSRYPDTAAKINLKGVAGLEAVDAVAPFAIGQPKEVDVNEIVFRPTKQEL